MSGLSPSQSAYEATLVQQAATIAASLSPPGQQAPVVSAPGESTIQQEAAGLEASVSGTLSASISGTGFAGQAFALPGTPPPSPLETPGTSPYQASLATSQLDNATTLFGTLGLGTNTNTFA
jgi:hypothetical protein